MILKNWKVFELVWLTTFLTIATIITLTTKDSLFNYFVLITGVFCVVLAAKGHLWTYIFGFVNSFAYAYVAYKNALFGELGLNILFFVPMNIIGFIMWKKKMIKTTVIMRALKRKQQVFLLLICCLGIFVLGLGLSLIETQNTPYIDATTNILSIIATFLMVSRFKEQWLLYIALNIFTILMWYIRTINGSGDGLMMLVMWSAFLVNAFYGYYNWNKQAKISTKESVGI